MNIIARNYFRLLRSGAFNEDVEIEPMSFWKWKRLYQYACLHGIHGVMYDGIEKCRRQFFMQLPDDLIAIWEESVATLEEENAGEEATMQNLYQLFSRQQLRPVLFGNRLWAENYPASSHRQNIKIELFFPFQTQFDKSIEWAKANGQNATTLANGAFAYEYNDLRVEHHHRLHVLTNKYLNYRLNTIVEREFRENKPTLLNDGTETISKSLSMLLIFLRFSFHMLNNGISLKHLCDLGIFLRVAGNDVDYVKLQGWLSTLQLKSIANIAGALLVNLFDFSYDELPFVTSTTTNVKPILSELFNFQGADKNSWYFKQGKDIFVHANNTSAMMWHVRQSGKYFRYYPSESITNFLSSFARSLSQIEE